MLRHEELYEKIKSGQNVTSDDEQEFVEIIRNNNKGGAEIKLEFQELFNQISMNAVDCNDLEI